MNSRKDKNDDLYFKKFSIIFIRIRNNIYRSLVISRFNLKLKQIKYHCSKLNKNFVYKRVKHI